MNKLFFEELEKVDALGAVTDFFSGAQPWVAMGLTAAVAIAFT